MIAYLEGRLAQVTSNSAVIITASGVGYEVFLPVHTLSHLPAQGGQVVVYTRQIVREDAHELFGFETWDERRTFETLVSLSKVGARTAVAVLSIYRPDDLRRIVLEGDATPLTRVSGIGKKTAQHVFLELKDKLRIDSIPGAPELCASGFASVYKDAMAGLEGLGYAESEAAPVLRKVLEDEPDQDVSGALRLTLRALARLKQGDDV